MSLKIDIKGQFFGDLEAIEYYKSDKWGSAIWLCKCKCGNNSYVRSSNLIRGQIKQCTSCATKKHGLSDSKIYKVWQGMKSRCSNPKTINYHNYGGRGISYPEKWEVFTNFYDDMFDGYQEGLTLERKDNSLGYSKENCEWVTPGKQNLNMRTNVLLSYKDKIQTINEWGKELNIDRHILYRLRRYYKDWTDKQVIDYALQK